MKIGKMLEKIILGFFTLNVIFQTAFLVFAIVTNRLNIIILACYILSIGYLAITLKLQRGRR